MRLLVIAVSVFGAIFLLVSITTLSGLNPDMTRELIARDHRINALERALNKMQSSLVALSSAQRGQERSRGGIGLEKCPVALGNLQSKEAMTAAGWEFSVSQEVFRDAEVYWGGHFVGWTDGEGRGELRVKFNTSGRMYLNLRDDHDSHLPTDFVAVWLNREPLAVLTSKQETQLCVPFQEGDVLSIEEIYGIIRLLGVSVFCPEVPFRSEPVMGKRCGVGQVVYVEQADCWRQSWLRGRIDRVLDESRAVVYMEDQVVGNTSRWQVHALPRLWVSTDSSRARCSSLDFVRRHIGIVQIADGLHMEKFKLHYRTQRCYALARGYDYWLLDTRSWPSCKKYEIWGASMFFAKHCIVRTFLELQEPDYVAVVIDTDVVPATLERGVEEWLRVDADVHFYERLIIQEIAAGNYIARNTPWARQFLFEWSERAFKLPVGYSSYDNGALHILLVEKFQLAGSEKCAKMYSELSAPMEGWPLNQNLTQYWEFVKCALNLLDAPRTWRIDGGSLAIWPRGNFFIADGVYVSKWGSNFMGPVLHHGIKQNAELTRVYFSNLDKCELNPDLLHGREEYSDMVTQLFNGYKQNFFDGQLCVQCTDECLRQLSCEPLAPDAQPQPVFRGTGDQR